MVIGAMGLSEMVQAENIKNRPTTEHSTEELAEKGKTQDMKELPGEGLLPPSGQETGMK
jgi:hypothetical protein